MSLAYVDTSYIVAIALGERDGGRLASELAGFQLLTSATLLEAEVRATLKRESRALDELLLRRIEWISPPRSIGPEIERVLDAGYVRGADCFHLASALFRVGNPADLTFLTLDTRQRVVAKALGFKT